MSHMPEKQHYIAQLRRYAELQDYREKFSEFLGSGFLFTYDVFRSLICKHEDLTFMTFRVAVLQLNFFC